MPKYALALIFFVSGGSGLVYEVLSAKYLTTVLGASAQAQAMVLAAFMGGLALGAFALGRLADRLRRHLRAYALLELGIGLWGALCPAMFRVLEAWATTHGIGAGETILRGALVVASLLPPTILMGGTLPLLARQATVSEEMGRAIARLYFINSLGAAFGAFATGFALIPALGLDRTAWLAAALNVLLAVGAFALDRSEAGPATAAEAVDEPASPLGRAMVLGAIGASGVVALAYEVAWTRLLSLVMGASVYSFALMLGTMIAGIALGSFAVTRLRRGAFGLFAACQVGLGATVLLEMPFVDRLPFWFVHLDGVLRVLAPGFAVHVLGCIAIASFIMLLPAVLFGAALPLAARIATPSADRTGSGVGRVVALNTTGNVLGALATGQWLLPAIGLQGLFELGAAMSLAIGLGLLLVLPGRRAWCAVPVALSALLGLYAIAVPPWDRAVLVDGAFRDRHPFLRESYADYRMRADNAPLRFYRDDPVCTVSVRAADGLVLEVDGKPDASTQADLVPQVLVGQLPLLLHPGAKEACLVGLGSGITAGAMLTHDLRRLDVNELSKGVIEACRWFEPFNHAALEDPRLHLHHGDGLTRLRSSDRRYDVIVSEPSNPWVAGVANLFTLEYLQTLRDHLAPGGVAELWFQSYEIDDASIRLILRTFRTVFPCATVWQIGPADFAVLGSAEPLTLRPREMAAEFERPTVLADVSRLGLHRLTTLLSLQVFDAARLRRLVGGGAVNSLYDPLLEYRAPISFYAGHDSTWLSENDAQFGSADAARGLYLTQALLARGRALTPQEWADIYNLQSQVVQNRHLATAVFSAWCARYPHDATAMMQRAQGFISKGKLRQGLAILEQVHRSAPGRQDVVRQMATLEYQIFATERSYRPDASRDLQAAIADYRALLAQHPQDAVAICRNLVFCDLAARTTAVAMNDLLRAARVLSPHDKATSLPPLWLMLARTALQAHDLAFAKACVNQALVLAPRDPAVRRLAVTVSHRPTHPLR